MLRSQFDDELNNMHVDLDRMCHLVIQAIENCVTAFKNQDFDLAKEIIENDKAINNVERAIESKCLALILKQQPVASDLRDVSTALKVVTDLERIGDQSADIAELILEIDEQNSFLMVEHIPAMADIAIKMVTKALNAFHEHDVMKAKEVKKTDQEMDRLFDNVKNELIKIVKEDKDNVDLSIHFLMIAKYFERIGDHVVNICEWIEFSQTGRLNDQRLI
ncbi:phosphate signaling complex protein PhoU [[Clostridium] spiroforme]|nr:phosphate signaling complex protein PhoU [Thomasclavelia spiroformis]